MTHEAVDVRATALRTLRCLLKKEEDVQEMTKLNIHILIAR